MTGQALRLAALLIAFCLLPLPAEARFDDRDATRLCKKEIRQTTGYREIYNVTARKKHHKKYKITGTIKIHHGKDRNFRCDVQRKRITNLSIEKPKKKKKKGSGGGLAGVIIGGILGAAIVGAISDDHKHHHQKHDPNYNTDNDFRVNWNDSYSPKNGITCFRGQRACYKDGKGYNAKWSRKEFN